VEESKARLLPETLGFRDGVSSVHTIRTMMLVELSLVLGMVFNLVRDSEEADVADKIKNHLAAESPVSFQRCSWESLFRLPAFANDSGEPLKHYVVNKTNKLAKAFTI
jgi:hypothetical protein